MDYLYAFLAFPAAILFGTFVEYFVHRFMHWGLLYPEGHAYHHDTNDARTFLKDFLDYGMGAAIGGWFGFLISVPVGIGWAAGAVIYAVLASYAHQLQHANAYLVFWMKRPVHRLHHAVDMRDGNFGILVDWWDRLFGTYVPLEWQRKPVAGRRLSEFFAIPWR